MDRILQDCGFVDYKTEFQKNALLKIQNIKEEGSK